VATLSVGVSHTTGCTPEALCIRATTKEQRMPGIPTLFTALDLTISELDAEGLT